MLKAILAQGHCDGFSCSRDRCPMDINPTTCGAKCKDGNPPTGRLDAAAIELKIKELTGGPMTKQELIVQMMDGEWWTHESAKAVDKFKYEYGHFYNQQDKQLNIFIVMANKACSLEGFHHYQEPKEQVEAWLWLLWDDEKNCLDLTADPYATKEDILEIFDGVTVLSKCEETLTMIDKE